MYIFSVTAKTRHDIEGFSKGQEVPFIVYINFKDLYGAEKLCQIFVIKEGFYDVVIEKRKLITEKSLQDQSLVEKDKALQEALKTGYTIQLFSRH
ncbi:hypothetical protein FKG94_27625 [Exilibacterium tricleocarpae]|uniref:Uncharacterized protein n=1 Tax=Exilibacterium tricleocarpae TaxID=2591008 RepID=A0A545SMG1_9GAMM|nr:hypothetical protein [Exilibacterium tricleocarpae]TQV66144.1 hypothetical protein FKG94_27625 [Exilibacterium tricleocarpae]